MRLALLHPAVAFRDCADCKRHMYDETTGKRKEWLGRPVARPAGCPPPCETSGGCPKGRPTGEPDCKELSEKNWQAWRHYRECVAVGDFPRDGTVRRNAAVIRLAEESANETRRAEGLGPLLPLAAALTRGR